MNHNLDFSELFPCYYLQIKLRFTRDSTFPSLHRYALAGFIRHLLDSPEGFSQYFHLDAVENAQLHYKKGAHYHFGVFCLNGAEPLLEQLILKLSQLPSSSPFADKDKPFNNNIELIEISNLLSSSTVETLADIAPITEAAFDTLVTTFNWNNPLTFQWLSPVRIKKKHAAQYKGEAKYCADADDLSCNKWLYHLYQNLATRLQQPATPEKIDALTPAADYHYQHCFWQGHTAKTNKQSPTTCGGMLGIIKIRFEEPLSFFWKKILYLTQFIGIGNLNSYGWGRYQLDPSVPRAQRANSLLSQVLNPANLRLALTHAATKTDLPLPTLAQLSINPTSYQAPQLSAWSKQKADGTLRILSAPPLLDKTLQRAMTQIIGPMLDANFYQHNYGFRAKRSRTQAMHLIQNSYTQGYRWVFESDVNDFFDVIDWQRLEQRLMGVLGNDACIPLIMKWVKADLTFGKMHVKRSRGLPQGSPISPLLSNLVLDDFDHDMHKAGFKLIRYADDFIVLAKDKQSVEKAHALAKSSLAEHGFELNSDKTHIVHQDHGFEYLGYLFISDQVFNKSDKQALPNHSQVLAKSLIRKHNLPQQLEQYAPPSLSPAAEQPSPIHHKSAQKGSFTIINSGFTKLSTLDNQLQISQSNTLQETIPWQQLSTLIIIGKHHLTTPVLYQAMQRAIPIHFISRFGHYQGELNSSQHLKTHKDLHLKQAQHFANPSHCLTIAKQIIRAKAQSQRIVLQQKHKSKKLAPPELAKINALSITLSHATTLAELRGYEGKISALYFQAIRQLLDPEWHFHTRNKNPPQDAFNVLLSMGYASLYAYTSSILRIAGLSPYLGFYHQPSGTHATLASDLMEPLRYLVERTAMKMISLKQIKPSDFHTEQGEIVMENAARNAYLSTLSTRFNTAFIAKPRQQRHDVFNHLHHQNLSLITHIYHPQKPFIPFTAQ